MRVTTQSITNNFLFNLNKHLFKINKYQNEISSGKKIMKPSDNPTGTSFVLELRSIKQKNEQYIRNIDDGMLRLNMTEDALNDTQNLINRTRDIALMAENGTTNEIDRQNMSIEVNELLEHLLMTTNKKLLDGYLFGATQTESNPFVEVRNVQGEIETVSTHGDISGELIRVVGDGQPVQVNTNGNGFFHGDNNLFQSLINLRDALRDNSIKNISDEIGQLNKLYEGVISQISEVGIKSRYLLDRKDELGMESLILIERMSEIEETEITESIVLLQQEEVAYQAALAVGSQLLKSTLMNYLE